MCEETKACTKCGIEKPLSAYAIEKNSKDGVRSMCRECVSEYDIERKYGLKPEDIKNITEEQNGCCACCGEKCDKLVVDHDHVTGKVRGLICNECNTGIGKCGDTVEGLLQCVKYLMRHEAEVLRKRNEELESVACAQSFFIVRWFKQAVSNCRKMF